MAQATYNAVWLEISDARAALIEADTASALTYGAWRDIPGALTFGMDPQILEHIIRGDNRILDTIIRGEGLQFSLTASIVGLDVLGSLLGATLSHVVTGGSSHSKMLLEDDDEHAKFKLQVQVARAKEHDGTSGSTGATITLFKCVVTGYSFPVQGDPTIVTISGRAFGTRNNKDMWEAVNYEDALHELVFDYGAKVAASTTANKHIAYEVDSATATLAPSDVAWAEISQGNYDNLEAQDASNGSNSTAITNGLYAMQLFKFDVLGAVNAALGTSLTAGQLESALVDLTLRWKGYATAPTANGAILQVYDDTGTAYVASGSGYKAGTASAVEWLTTTIDSDLAKYINSSGFLYAKVRSTNAANGATGAAVYTDYVQLEVRLRN